MAGLISFVEAQRHKFHQIIALVKDNPELYLNFETIADVYQAQWLKQLPPMCKWYVSGLDDGAEEFFISIYFADESVCFSPCGQRA